MPLFDTVVSDRLVDGCGIEWSLETEKVRSMPRRAAKIAQGEIARVIRAAREAGAAEVIIDGEGQIHVMLPPNVPAASTSPSEEDDDSPVWTMSVPARKQRWSSRELLGAIFQSTCSDLDLHNRQVVVRCNLPWPTMRTAARA
jgi:hypothetical protein